MGCNECPPCPWTCTPPPQSTYNPLSTRRPQILLKEWNYWVRSPRPLRIFSPFSPHRQLHNPVGWGAKFGQIYLLATECFNEGEAQTRHLFNFPEGGTWKCIIMPSRKGKVTQWLNKASIILGQGETRRPGRHCCLPMVVLLLQSVDGPSEMGLVSNTVHRRSLIETRWACLASNTATSTHMTDSQQARCTHRMKDDEHEHFSLGPHPAAECWSGGSLNNLCYHACRHTYKRDLNLYPFEYLCCKARTK